MGQTGDWPTVLPLMRKVIFIILFLFQALDAQAVFATGWDDYELPIGDDYSIVRANSFEIMLVRSGSIIISNHDFHQIGPITGYFKDSKLLFVRTAGMKIRKLFPEDDFRESDLSKQFYFVVMLPNAQVTGPLSETEFQANSLVAAHSGFTWLAPRNPSLWRPLSGTLIFLALSVLVLYVKFIWIALPVSIILFWLWFRKRQNKRLQTSR